MSDSRSRFEAWEKENIPEWLPANGPARLFARHAWQAAEAETARRCLAVLESVSPFNPMTVNDCIDAIRAEFAEAFRP